MKDSNNWLRFVVEGDSLQLQSNAEGVKSSTTVQFDQKQHRFWRFRYDAMSRLLMWETSPDNLNWNVQHAMTPKISVDSLFVELIAGADRAIAVPGKAAFGGFSLMSLN